jgi:hypothetical protein
MFVTFQHRTGVEKMAEIFGPTKIHKWLQANPAWNGLLPDVMQNITLQHSVGDVPQLTQPSIRKM